LVTSVSFVEVVRASKEDFVKAAEGIVTAIVSRKELCPSEAVKSYKHSINADLRLVKPYSRNLSHLD